MPATRPSLFSAISALADEIQSEKAAAAGVVPSKNGKSAAAKRADGPTPPDPGNYDSKSEHPTATADNSVQKVETGARAAENEKDVKEQQREPSVENAPEAKPGDDKDKAIRVGMDPSAVGEDPSVEDNYKGNKEDPGTASPATVEDGVKYGSCSFKDARTKAASLANSIMADFANGYGDQLGTKKAGAPPAASKAAAAPVAPPAEFLAGYELAAKLGMDKLAAEAQVADIIENTLQDALIDADLFGGWRTKIAADEAAAGEDHTKPGGGDDSGSGKSPVDAGPPAEGGPDHSKPGGGGGGDALAMLGGGAGGAAGGSPPMDPGAGAPPGDMPPGAGGPPVSQEEALQELVAALAELGISPEMLAQVGQAAGGAPGGAPPGAGGPPPGAGGPPPTGGGGGPPMDNPMMDPAKVAALAQNYMRSGKYQIKAAATKRSRELRDQMKSHVIELCNRAAS